MQSKIARTELLMVSSESLPEEQSDGGISSSRLVPQAYCLSTPQEIGDMMTKLPVNGECTQLARDKTLMRWVATLTEW